MDKIAFVYIATHSTYFRHLAGFVKTLQNFCPAIKDKYLVIFTDQPESLVYDTVMQNNNTIKVIYKKIEHKPWPMNALLKFEYVKQAIDELTERSFGGDNLIFYADSKVEFRNKILIAHIYEEDKITTVLHNMYPNYPTDYQLLQFWVQNKDTNANIEGHYTYHQSGFFGGKLTLVYEAVRQCIQWTNQDLANHRIPCVDDESYWNRWIYEHPNRVFTLPEGFWGCATDPESPWHNASINLRDHGDAEWYKYQVKEGLV